MTRTAELRNVCDDRTIEKAELIDERHSENFPGKRNNAGETYKCDRAGEMKQIDK